MTTFKLILLRHGEGTWNKQNRFCSWVDQKLTEDGIKEARACGQLLKQAGFEFDLVFTSLLSRSIQTAWYVLQEMDQEWVPMESSWRLNERHYGALIGLNRKELSLKHGEEKVKLWRRSFDIRPPPIDESHPFFQEIYRDRRYSNCDLPKHELPTAESLKDVLVRLLPYWNEVIAPEVKKGKCVLISAHGNSTRALLKHLEGIEDDKIINVTMPPCVPLLLELDENLVAVKPHIFLGDPKTIQNAIEQVDNQSRINIPTQQMSPSPPTDIKPGLTGKEEK